MKKLVILLAAVMLLFGVSGRALAYFNDGDLIQVVYSTTDSYEVATNLGAFAPTSPYSGSTVDFTSNPFPAAGTGAFQNSSWANLNVAYFVSSGLANGPAWVSGPTTGQSSGSSGNSFTTAATAILNNYMSSAPGQAQAIVLQAGSASYRTLMDQTYTVNGGFAGLIGAANGETNLAALGNGTGSYVDSYLYYYPSVNTPGSGVAVADIRTNADGTSEIVGGNGQNSLHSPHSLEMGDPTPVPPSVLLMGSGLLGLAGIRRKKTV